jgi:beta-galactosidase
MNTFERMLLPTSVIILALTLLACSVTPSNVRKTELLTAGWQFHLGDIPDDQSPALDDSPWRTLDLPHDWSIEGKFSKDNPATAGGGALPGGIGWYRKSFTVPDADTNKLVFIDFDGVYRNSEVWINGQSLGKRPYGYSSFRYELTPYLKHGAQKNLLAVKVDNSQQPNSRWYSGSGIYRNVRLVTTDKVHVDHWGTFITTPEVTTASAKASIAVKVRNASPQNQPILLRTVVLDDAGRSVAQAESQVVLAKDSASEIVQALTINSPVLWTIESPRMYKAVTTVECNGTTCDEYETPFGIRTFTFDRGKGFSLNGKPMKIKGVCNHHDLGCLGSAVNTRALERQLEIMKAMGVNGIRTSHNPPAPELLDLCDRMGFIVMDEAFDMWKKKKTAFDYALHWDEWHVRDLEGMVLRDRNHPSVFIWSIGNEVMEQWDKDTTGSVIARELAGIVRTLDTTRPVTSACNSVEPNNPLITSGALDLTGLNYHHEVFPNFPTVFPGKTFLGSETTSAIATRGYYDMPSDSVRKWPIRWDIPFTTGNPDLTCSAYDNCRVPWGSTHEESWKIIKKYDFLCGMYIWTGFDYLGEPTPYDYPARSSYFGIVDLAGFPKDAYYMYQSEWTDTPVLHILPHWNWKEGTTVDVVAYTSCDEVELFLNGQSVGTKKKAGDDLHMVWRVPYAAGTVQAVGRTAGKEPITTEIKTAGAPARIVLEADRNVITADGRDLSFVTVKVVDHDGTIVPNADNLIRFAVSGNGTIAGVDNGLQTSDEPFKADYRKAFNGMCLAVIQSNGKAGSITLTARSSGLADSSVEISAQ